MDTLSAQPPQPQLPSHHVPHSLKVLLLVFALALIVALGYIVWLQNHSASDSTNEALLHPKTTQKSSSSIALANCQTADLQAVLTAASGTAGTYYFTLALTNKGTQSCTISGSPTIAALDAAGNEVGRTTPTTHTAAKLTIAAGSKVYSSIGFPDSGSFDAASCKAMKSLAIYPPDQATALTIADINQYNTVFTSKYCQELKVTDFSATQP